MADSSRRRAGFHESIQSSDTPSNRPTIKRLQSEAHPLTSLVSSFQNARINGGVNNSRLYTAGGDLIVNDNDLVTMILSPHVASGAIFDSDERYSAGRCHPGTRQRIIARVKNWIHGTSPDRKGILWIYGPAGAGKSSIMQSICEFLRDSAWETNRASFFFARGNTDRGKATKLFVTLAYQLAVQFRSLRAEINNALHRDATLPTKSMDIQLRSLIIDPFLRCKDRPSPTPIIFIDGLDECNVDDAQGVETQCQILTLIAQTLVNHKIPIRFMIASRPEYWIRDSFETSPLLDITLPLSLRDDIDADKDIRDYLTQHFDQIRLKKIRIMRSVALPWPPYNIVSRFVEEASGQYIYASTILKFIGDHPFKSPVEQLQIITTPGPHRATAYSELDRLYATIVSVYPEWETMKRVLGGLLIDINLAAIQVFLEVPRSEITLVLDALRSLIDVVPPGPLSKYDQLLIPIFGPSFEDEQISFCHLSFREFLLDEARSGSYHINIQAVYTKVLSAFFGIIQRNLNENYEIEPHISCYVSLLEYRRMMDAIIKVVDTYSYDFRNFFPMLHGMMHGMMETFRRFDPGRLECMGHPACFMRDMNLLSAFLEKLVPAEFNQPTFRSMERQQSPLSKDSLIAIVSQLQNLASKTREIGIRLLAMREGFSITHTLFLLWYLQPSSGSGVKIDDLLQIPGSTVNDTLSTILQHRHIINAVFYRIEREPWERSSLKKHLYMSVVNLRQNSVLEEHGPDDARLYWPIWTDSGAVVALKPKIGKGWLRRTEWTNQHVSLVCEFLRSIMNNLYSHWEGLSVSDKEQDNTLNVKETILVGFFSDGSISDIRGEHYFGNKYHLCFLQIMVDLKAWLALFLSRPYIRGELETFIAPVLCWFNRQLANPKTAKLIDDHDDSLLSKMTMVMNTIFQKCLVPLFTTPDISTHVISTWISEHQSIEIKVSSSSYSEEAIDSYPDKYNSVLTVGDIHNEHAGGDQSIIPRSEWYPYLAAYLLNICVKDLQVQTNDFKFRFFFPYIVQCLPYAQTTRQNLDTLRAIKNLSKKSQGFNPPSGFCSGARKFLERYDQYALYYEELSDFKLWLQGITEVSLEDWDTFILRDIKKNTLPEERYALPLPY